jgi:hypothetical protein
MAGTPTDDDLQDVLRGLGYELWMMLGLAALRDTPMQLNALGIDPTAERALVGNALIEAQCVHVRTLVEFFFVSKKRVTASAFVPDWRSTYMPDSVETLGEDAGRLNGDLNVKLSHVSTPRGDKREWDSLPRIANGLMDTARLFDSLLSQPRSDALHEVAPNLPWADRPPPTTT